MNKRKKVSKKFSRTDTGNAELIATLFGDVLRYDHKQGRWLVWNKRRRRWNEDKTNRVCTFAIEAARHRKRAAVKLADNVKSKQELLWGFESENRPKLDAALAIAKSLLPISDSGDGWDADPWLLGVANGILNLRTGKLRDERQEDRITKHSPVPFVADALCSRFERFLTEIFNGDQARIDYLQRFVGYCLTGSVQEQCFSCWHGCGSNGKTTLINVLRHIFGDYVVNLPFSALEMKNRNSNDLVSLAGARLATAAETNEGVRLNEARIKVLTGGDPITARRLYQNNFTFEPTHKLVLAFNHKPTIEDDSEGMWRRVRLMPFTRQFGPEEQEKDLQQKLKAEGPGILAWAVRGCLLWQNEGLGMPSAVTEATAAYRVESDHLGAFLEDCCMVEPGATISSKALSGRYLQWCEERDEEPVSRKIFAERLERRGCERNRSGHGGTRIWTGIRLREDLPIEPLFYSGSQGDTVTPGDAISDISPMQRDMGKFSESASACVSMSAVPSNPEDR